MTESAPAVGWNSPDPPVPVDNPMLLQLWRDCVFLHWALDPSVLRPLVPAPFEIETFEETAWVSLISFRIPFMRGGPFPPVPGLRVADETHLRTYVVGPDGRRGIWMISLDIDPAQAAALGRFAFALPYWWTRMRVERNGDRVRYRMRRGAGRDARLRLDVDVGAPIPDVRVGPLDHFLTARWVLYNGVAPVNGALLVEHERWRLREATVRDLRQTITSVDGVGDLGPPTRVHFSDGVDARLSWPRPALSTVSRPSGSPSSRGGSRRST